MSHEARRDSATHRVDIGVVDDILIKGATALPLQIGVLASPFPTTGSRVVTLRNHQNIIKLLQHAHSAVVALRLRLTSTLFVFFFLPFPSLSLGGKKTKQKPAITGVSASSLRPVTEASLISAPATAKAGPSHGRTGEKVIKIFNKWHGLNNNVKDELLIGFGGRGFGKRVIPGSHRR